MNHYRERRDRIKSPTFKSSVCGQTTTYNDQIVSLYVWHHRNAVSGDMSEHKTESNLISKHNNIFVKTVKGVLVEITYILLIWTFIKTSTYNIDLLSETQM